LFEHRVWSAFSGEDEFVFAHPRTGRATIAEVYAPLFKKALAKADVEDSERIRPFHDLRHSSLTNGAKAGMSPAALQARAGHSSYSITQRYVSLSGEAFREEAGLLERRLWGEQKVEEAARD
jgi:integrase